MAIPKIAIFNPSTTLIDQVLGIDGSVNPTLGVPSAGTPVCLNPNGLIDPSLGGTGVTISNPPSAGAILQATGVKTAIWVTPSNYPTLFGDITTDTNTAATMTVGTGAALTFSGSGVVNANTLFGVALGGTVPTTGWVLTATSPTTADWAPSGGGGTPGGSPTQLQFNNTGVFGGASNSSVSGTGAIVLGNTVNGSPTASTALTVSGAGGIVNSIQDWYSSNEGTIVGQLFTSGLLQCNGVSIISNVSIGAHPALSVAGGNAGSPDVADFITAFGASPSSTKVFWIDYSGNVHILEGLFDGTGSLGLPGYVLSTTGSTTHWIPAAGGSPGGTNRQIQFNNAGVFGGMQAETDSNHEALWINPTGAIGSWIGSPGLSASLIVYGDTGGDYIAYIQANGDFGAYTYIDPHASWYMQSSVSATAPTLTINGNGMLDAFVVKQGSGGNNLTVFSRGSVLVSPLIPPDALGVLPAFQVNSDTGGTNDIADFYDASGTPYNVVAIAQPNTASKAAMSVTGDVNGNDILDLHANDTTLIYSVNSFGSVHISPETGDPTFPALTVQGQSNNTAVFYGQSGGTLTVDTNAKLILAPSVGGAATLQVQDDGGGTNDIADFIYEAGPYNVVGIAQPNTGGVAAIYVNGDANGNDIAKFFGNTGVTGYTGNVQSGTNLGVEITKFGAVVVSPTGPVLTYPGASLVVYVDSPVAHVIDAYGTGSHTVPSFFISGTGTTVCQPQQAAADSLYVYGATGSANLTAWFDNTTTVVASIDLYGEMLIKPNTIANTATAALTVAGDAFGDDVLHLQTNGHVTVTTVDQYGGVNITPAAASPASITNVSESVGNVVTLTVTADTFSIGEYVFLSGLTAATWLNGLTLQLISPTNSTTLTVNDPTLNGTFGPSAETGTAVLVQTAFEIFTNSNTYPLVAVDSTPGLYSTLPALVVGDAFDLANTGTPIVGFPVDDYRLIVADYQTASTPSFIYAGATQQFGLNQTGTVSLTLTSNDASSAGTTVVHGTFPGGGSDAYAGYWVQISGNLIIYGVFQISASTTTTLTLETGNTVYPPDTAVSDAEIGDNQEGWTGIYARQVVQASSGGVAVAGATGSVVGVQSDLSIQIGVAQATGVSTSITTGGTASLWSTVTGFAANINAGDYVLNATGLDIEITSLGAATGIAVNVKSMGFGGNGFSYGAKIVNVADGDQQALTGIYSQVGISYSGGDVPLAYGVFIDSPTFVGAPPSPVTALYGLYIADQTVSPAYNANPWAIFVAGGVSQFTGVATAIVTKTTTYTATQNDHTINCNGTFTLTLPTTNIKVGQEFYIKNIGVGVITVSSSVNIDFALTLSLSTQGQSTTVQWDGTQYWVY